MSYSWQVPLDRFMIFARELQQTRNWGFLPRVIRGRKPPSLRVSAMALWRSQHHTEGAYPLQFVDARR